jgi:hypothetical protein
MGFNERDVLFSDVSSIIKKNYPLILQSVMHSELEENVAVEICEKYAALLLSTFQPFDSSKYGDSCVNGSEIYLCLQPTGETDEYRVISFKSNLELVMKLEQDELSRLFDPKVKIDVTNVKKRTRPYLTEVPILKCIEDLAEDCVFVENSKVRFMHHKFINEKDVTYSETQFNNICMRASFVYPWTFLVGRRQQGNKLCSYFIDEDEEVEVSRQTVSKSESARLSKLKGNDGWLHITSVELVFAYMAMRTNLNYEKINYCDLCIKTLRNL